MFSNTLGGGYAGDTIGIMVVGGWHTTKYIYEFVPGAQEAPDITPAVEIDDTDLTDDGSLNDSPGGSIGGGYDHQHDDSGGVIGPVLIGGAIITGVTALIVLAANKKKNTGGNKPTPPPPKAPPETPEKQQTEEKKASTFRMEISKDFGNKIRYGAPPVSVYARMVEIKPDGVHCDRPDLTANIAITGDAALKVQGFGAIGSFYKSACVSAERKQNVSNPDSAVVSFQFTGPGGTYRNNVRFKLIGDAKIVPQTNTLSLLFSNITPCALPYKLVDFMENNPVVQLDFDKSWLDITDGRDQTGGPLLHIKPTPGLIWDEKKFEYPIVCQLHAKDGWDEITASITVKVCFEGIGCVIKGGTLRTVREEHATITAIKDGEDASLQRIKQALTLPLVVMRWNPDKKLLESDMDAAKALTADVSVSAKAKFKTDTARAWAHTALRECDLRTEVSAGGNPHRDIAWEPMYKPVILRTMAMKCNSIPLDQFAITVAVELPDNSLTPLVFEGTFIPYTSLKEVVRWFFADPAGTFAASRLIPGQAEQYCAALDFIGERVYTFENVPFQTSVTTNHYDAAPNIIAREVLQHPKCIVLHDRSYPYGIGDFNRAASLVHELTHAIEDQHGEYGGGAGAERHAYFLQYAATTLKTLADGERGLVSVDVTVGEAIKNMNETYFNPENTAEPRCLGWFGATVPTQHRLFSDYIKAYENGDGTDAVRAIGETLSRAYYPCAPCGADPASSLGHGRRRTMGQQGGFFENAQWTFRWSEGNMSRMEITHKKYVFSILSGPRWNGDEEKILHLQIRVQDALTVGGAGTGDYSKRSEDVFRVELRPSVTPGLEDFHYIPVSSFSARFTLVSGDPKTGIAGLVMKDSDTMNATLTQI